MKKFFVVVLLAILAVLLSACSEKVSYVENETNLIKEIEVIEITVIPIEVTPIEIKGL